jgi:uncharacterized protein (TIGR03437 family)
MKLHLGMRGLVMLALLCGPATAAPILRLSTSALVWPPGGPATQTVYAFNAGDGTLTLSALAASGSKWLTVTVGTPQAYPGDGRLGVPLLFTIDVSGLAWGTYTASVTVSDPHAIDAPQVVTATVRVNGGDPVAIDRYLAPGRQTDIPLQTNYCPPSTARTQDGVAWLSVVELSQLVGTTGYQYRICYGIKIHLAPPASMTPATYSGSVAVNEFNAIRTIPVTMRVTTQPIAVPSASQIQLRLTEGGPAAAYPFLPPISLANSGMGALHMQGVAAAGEGVSAYQYGELAVVTVGPGSRGTGKYNDGVVTIQCDGANCPVQVPVNLEVVPRAAPAIAYRGVVDNATFDPSYPVAPGDVCMLWGEHLSLSDPATAVEFRLPTSLGGATVLVNDVKAPLYYTSFGQIAFQMPYSTVTGTALVQVERDGQISNTVTVNVVGRAPQILSVTNEAYQLRDATHPTRAGETLVIFAIGLGATEPPIEAGTFVREYPPPFIANPPQVRFQGGISAEVTPTYAGLAGLSGGGTPGLYMVIVAVPADMPKGSVYVWFDIPNVDSNAVQMGVQ